MRDTYRAMSTEALLGAARENGIDPDMAVVMAERIEVMFEDEVLFCLNGHASMGGRYTFNHRSMA